LEQGDTFAIPVPALTEMLYGIQTLPRARQNLAEWVKLHRFFDYYGVERMDAEHAASLQIGLRRRGRRLDTVDALIAAIALRFDHTLLTSDRDFSAISDLNQENWL
jgi:predicted nucleic acid-binding protein